MRSVLCLWGLMAAVFAFDSVAVTDSLEAGFLDPPRTAKPHTWFHMMNGNVTKEGITFDFEAIARAGLGGVQMFDAGCNIPAGPLKFNSPEWFDMFKHAAKEAKRLGLEICIPNCSGWSSSGGPWITPEKSMKFFTTSKTDVTGPCRFDATLPREQKDNGFYEDVAVVAYPIPPAEKTSFADVKTKIDGSSATLSAERPFTLSGFSYRIDRHGWWGWAASMKVTLEVSDDGVAFRPFETFTAAITQSGSADYSLRFHPFARPLTARALRLTVRPSDDKRTDIAEFIPETGHFVSDLAAKTFRFRMPVVPDRTTANADQTVAKDRVIELTKSLDKSGRLVWDVPAGDWRIVRLGMIANGRHNHPASQYGRGLEVDKLSASSLEFHINQYVDKLCQHLGDLAGGETGFNNILVDSYEVGAQNWTQGFEHEFARRTGYAMTPWYPVLAGAIVGSVADSERFLEDFRRVVSDLFSENYAGALTRLCRERGLMCSLEPYGNCPADNLQYGASVDIPMGEFWSTVNDGDFCTGTGNARYVSYLAHVWGRRYSATESFTANPGRGGRWQTTPFSIKLQGDRVYCEGVNRIIYHRFCHQPWVGYKYLPGMTMGKWGMHLDRNQTWWDLAGGWFKYQTRCQYMLQQGKWVADVLFYCGEEVPNDGGNTDGVVGATRSYELPAGWKGDVCNTKALHALKVDGDGSLVVPGGVRYRFLALPSAEAMTPATLDRLLALQRSGAKIVLKNGELPVRSIGLASGPDADRAVRERVEALKAGGLVRCATYEESLRRFGDFPDFRLERAPNGVGAAFAHRRDGTNDWYFVSFDNREPGSFEVSLRETGRRPEIWDAEKGTVEKAVLWHVEGDRTHVTLNVPTSGSAFIVLREKDETAASSLRVVSAEPAAGADWRVTRENGQATLRATVPAKVTLRDGGGRLKCLAVNDVTPPCAVEGAWTVEFPNRFMPNKLASGAPERVTFERLVDWTMRPEEGVRYFSGSAVYRKTVEYKRRSGERIWLDLGSVKNFAEVTLNGQSFAPLWKPPFRVDVTDALRDGENALEIRVTNLWPNRLIGDAKKPEDCAWKSAEFREAIVELPDWVKKGEKSPTGRFTFTTWKHWNGDDALLPSGLLGPVKLESERASASVYDAQLFSQVPVRDWIVGDRDRYLADVRAAGVDCVLASFGDFYAFGAKRAAFFESLAQEIRFFEGAGVPVMVWTDTLGYGDVRTTSADGKARFDGAQPLLGVEGGSNGAICPLDPKMRDYACETMGDIAKTGARFILVDDDFVQSARGRLGCACPRHLARVAAKLGRTVTREEVLASFAGAPNPVRSAFVDVTGEVAMEFAGQMRAAVNAVNSDIVMGLCLSYSHWDVEGVEMDALLGVLAGPGRRKIVRISGAPYWWDGKYHNAGLEGVIEFVRMQAEWTRGTGWKVFDENDPYPRKVAEIPAWRCELYDKAMIADGLMARHKYMLCYGPKRTEPGYLDAHLANMGEDAKIREIFANTEPAGVYVPHPRRRIREATLPTPRRGEAELVGLSSFPMDTTALVHCGIPVRHDPSPKSYTLDPKQLGIDLWEVNFASYPRERVRENVLKAAERAGCPAPVYAETKSTRVYLLLRYDAARDRYVALLENFGKESADVRLVTHDKGGSVEVKGLAPHSWRVVTL